MRSLICLFLLSASIICSQSETCHLYPFDIPADLPIPLITTNLNASEGYIFAAVPYWGVGNYYLVIYDDHGKPVYFKKTKSTCTDFKIHKNGLFTYFDYHTNKFFALDSTFTVVDSFWTQNGFVTDEHDIKILDNGNILLIGNTSLLVDMSQFIDGGQKTASIVVNVIQEINPKKEVVFEWKAYEHYKYTDVGPSVNLLNPAFVHSHINSIELDIDDNIIVSSRNLNEITKINRLTGEIIWRLGGKNNQFTFINDTLNFSVQHSAQLLSNGNLLLFDNGYYRNPGFSRAIEYKIDQLNKTAELVWSYSNNPEITSQFWGNAQRLSNGNTFISWGLSQIAATEVDEKGKKVFEITFNKDVYSYRIYKFPLKLPVVVSIKDNLIQQSNAELFNNYPNPFNSLTKIRFSITRDQFVKINLYDILGQRVKTILSEYRRQGLHEILFDASDLASGIYIYAMMGDDLLLSRMLTIAK